MSKRRRSVYLDESLWSVLVEVAAAEDRSVNSVVRRLLTEGLASHEGKTYTDGRVFDLTGGTPPLATTVSFDPARKR